MFDRLFDFLEGKASLNRKREQNLDKLFNLRKSMSELEDSYYLVKSIAGEQEMVIYKYLGKRGEIEKEIGLLKGELNILNKKINKGFMYKNYLGESLGKMREEMPQIPDGKERAVLDHFVKTGVPVTKEKVSIVDLKPSQSEFDDNIIEGKIEEQDFKPFYFVSQDSYLCDGHHSWAGELEKGPKIVNIYRIHLPIEELLKRLNLLKVTYNIEKGEDQIGKPIEMADIDSTLDNCFNGSIQIGSGVSCGETDKGFCLVFPSSIRDSELSLFVKYLKDSFEDFSGFSNEGNKKIEIFLKSKGDKIEKSLSGLLEELESLPVNIDSLVFLNLEKILQEKGRMDRGGKYRKYNQKFTPTAENPIGQIVELKNGKSYKRIGNSGSISDWSLYEK